jgi:hypothetical protein
LTAARYKELDRIREEIRRSGRWGPRDEAAWTAVRRGAWRRAVRTVVFGEVLRAEAEVIRRLGFDVSERMVEERWRQMLRDAGGPAELARAQGFSVAALKELARDELLAEAYRQHLRYRQARPTPQEVADFYKYHSEEFRRPESVKARAVVIRRFLYAPAGAPAERQGAARRAGQVLAEAQGRPEDFPKLAEKFSEDPASAARGGLLGEEKQGFLIPRGVYEPALEKALFATRPGEVAGVIEGAGNCYVIQVLKRFPAGVPPLAEIEDEVFMRCYLERLRKVEEQFFRDSYHKVLVLDASGRRIAADDFFAAPKGPPRKSLFDREDADGSEQPEEGRKESPELKALPGGAKE